MTQKESLGPGELVKISMKAANPSPLGLLAFGTTTILLNLHNVGLFGLNSMILCMGIFYGGIAQVIAGVMEWKGGNTFGATAFTSYGLFWLTLVGIIVTPKLGLPATGSGAMTAYFGMWGLLTAALFVGTLRISRGMQLVFATLAILFFLLAASDAVGSALIGKAAGYIGIACGFSAIYTGIAQVINEIYHREMPI